MVGLIDLGHQPEWEYQGKVNKSQFKLTMTYELVSHLMKDGRPFLVSEDINVNDFEPKPGQEGAPSTMMLRVRALDPENETQDGTDLTKLLGKPALVTVTLNDKGYPKIKRENVSGVPAGVDVPDLSNDTYSFDLTNPDRDLYESFSDFVKGKIQRALNFKDSPLAKEEY